MAKILLIEDDKMMIDLLGTLLGMEGYQITKLSDHMNLEEMLAIIRQEKPELILLDVFLFDLDGCDVLKAVRNDEELKSTHIILTSGMALPKDCVEHGADDFIMKPYMLEELLSKINHSMGKVT